MAKQQGKPQPAPAKKAEAKTETVLTSLIPEPLAKKIFFAFAALLFIVMVFTSHQYGISGDENFHREYGHDVVDFYTSLGKENAAATTVGRDSLMVYYGGFYDGTATLISKALPSINEWDVRHAWNSMFGFLAMFCAGLVAVEIMGWQAGLIALIFMAFSPRFFGESMNNPKDITMAAGYMLAYVFILKFLKQMPKPTLKIAISLGLSIGMAMGIRIGGLLLIPYLFLFYGLYLLFSLGFAGLFDFSKFKETIWPSFKFVLLAAVVGYFTSLLFWPYGLVAPFSHPLEALGVAKKFPANITILFAGEHIKSTEVPWYYIPKWLLISTPLFGLIGLVFSLGVIPYMKQSGKLLLYSFLYFTILFPIAYVIYEKAVLYDAMRHFFFVYPSIVILAALAFNFILSALPAKLKYVALGVMLVLVALPARFMLANHPNQAVYFNELVGGIKGAFGNYETDYYMNSAKQAAEWLRDNENLSRTDGRKTIIYSNAVTPVQQYFKSDTAHVAVGYESYRQRSEKDADYEIMYCRFIDRDLLLNGCFPPEQTIHTVYADGVPLACVIKRTDKSDYLAQELMAKNDFAGAVTLLESYTKKYPKSEKALANLGLAYLNTQRLDDAIRVLSQSLALNKENSNAGYFLGLAYLYKQDFTNAASILTNVVKQNPYFPQPYRALAECMSRLGDQNAASYYGNIYQQLGGR